ncbi:MAG: pantoate--beta-alanine ligase [Gammaproteobacteria bacterium]
MQIIHNLQEWQSIRRQIAPELSLGFVPTMGNLHIGHQSLMQTCRSQNDLSMVSIFINPAQFERKDDFQNYPKTLEKDLDLLQKLGIDYCLVPDAQHMYADDYQYRIEEHHNSLHLEGPKRPGHFSGVLTVVMKLFQLIKPHRAYFGDKDYQQCKLIAGMVKAFFLDTKIVICPTIREADGLPYSSRNTRLTPQQRIIAKQFATIFHQDKSCEQISKELINLGLKVDYIEEYEQRRFAAVYIDDIRLIDNYELEALEK